MNTDKEKLTKLHVRKFPRAVLAQAKLAAHSRSMTLAQYFVALVLLHEQMRLVANPSLGEGLGYQPETIQAWLTELGLQTVER